MMMHGPSRPAHIGPWAAGLVLVMCWALSPPVHAECAAAAASQTLRDLDRAEAAVDGADTEEHRVTEALKETAQRAACDDASVASMEHEIFRIDAMTGMLPAGLAHLRQACDLYASVVAKEKKSRYTAEPTEDEIQDAYTEFTWRSELLPELIKAGRIQDTMAMARQLHAMAMAYDFGTLDLAGQLQRAERAALLESDWSRASAYHDSARAVATGQVKKAIDMMDDAEGAEVSLLLGDYDQALRSAQQAHTLLEAQPDARQAADALTVLRIRGEAYAAVGEPERAAVLYKEGDELVPGVLQAASQPADHSVAEFEAMLLCRDMAETDLLLGHKADAVAQLDKASEHAKTAGLPGLDGIYLGRLRMAMTEAAAADHETDRKRAREIMVDSNDLAGQWLLDLEGNGGLSPDVVAEFLGSPGALESITREDRILLLSRLADRYAALGEHASATKFYLAATQLIEQGRLYATAVPSLRDFFADYVGIYDDAIDSIYAESQQRSAQPGADLRRFGTSFAAAAFRLADAAHARQFSQRYGPAILDRLGDGAGGDPSVEERARELYAQLHAEISAAHFDFQLPQARQRIDIAAQRYLDYVGSLDPHLSILSHPQPVMSENLPSSLDGTYIALYKVTDSAVYSWVVLDRKILEFDRYDIARVALRRGVDNFLGDMDDASPNGGTELFQALVQRAFAAIDADSAARSSGVPHVVVIPDDVLYRLPWEALPGMGSRYLGESHVISYAPSVAALLQSIDVRLQGSPSSRALVVGDAQESSVLVPTDLGVKPFEVLQATETAQTADGLRRAGYRVDLLTGASASPHALLTGDERAYRIVHFDAHAFAETRIPPPSLVLHAEDDAPYGLLSLVDVPRMRLRARLVVLSACESGLGERPGSPAVPGEGIESLGTAFLLAGAKSTIASLWEVNSEKIPTLMAGFYGTLGKNPHTGLAKALFDAKLKLLKAGQPPSVWAAFVLIGDPRQ